ncbi:4-aminobutyrate aminotransferase [Chitinivorax tropicus]|uniref:4-aminobutyrate aminotransferase n=1 Tax=Chitinivorax tropicus TaxID=714531 RepID=A0A840MSM6_9PROT|nr:4-aminobutyrate--2-oxoglutarate transaminase [Chitinivorax tropicus]MBB5019283.1 4-aminobutyrate aminotransferase [Chitinivorax tropicus]
MASNTELHQRRNAVFPRGMGALHPIYIERARNAEMWDVEGKRYIDFAGGIAVLNTGHSHPVINLAVQQQVERFSHTCLMVNPYESAIELAEKLCTLAPISGEKKAFFVSTGAEAVENAIKIARAATGRSGVIAFTGGFHGRTHYAMGLTGKVVPYKAGFGPFPAEIHHVPFPIEYHGVTVEDSIAAIHSLFKCSIEPSRVAAIILEPVQGEGGFYAAPPELMRALRQICDQHGILLIADEIQTGFARTGTMFAMQQYDVEADLMTMAKSLAGGYPLAAVVGRAAVMDAPAPGGLGGTYAGSPVAIAAALAVLKVIEDEQLVQRSQTLGELLLARLKALQARYPQRIGEVRGKGAMVAMEFVKQGDAHQPDADVTKAVVLAAAQAGLILLSCGTYANVIRFLMPLTAPDALVEEGLAILATVLEQTLV